jgi:hypothetical protein
MNATQSLWLGLLAGVAALTATNVPADAQQKQPNIVMLMSDDTGWADLGAYLGGANLGHPTPNTAKRPSLSKAEVRRRRKFRVASSSWAC